MDNNNVPDENQISSRRKINVKSVRFSKQSIYNKENRRRPMFKTKHIPFMVYLHSVVNSQKVPCISHAGSPSSSYITYNGEHGRFDCTDEVDSYEDALNHIGYIESQFDKYDDIFNNTKFIVQLRSHLIQLKRWLLTKIESPVLV